MSKTYEGTVTSSSYNGFSVSVDNGVSAADRPTLVGRKVKVKVVDTPQSVLAEMVGWWDSYATADNLRSRFPKGAEIVVRARGLVNS